MTNTFGVVVVPEYNERMITEFKCGNTFRFVVDNRVQMLYTVVAQLPFAHRMYGYSATPKVPQ